MAKSYRFKISRGKRKNKRLRRLMMKWGYGLTLEDRNRVLKRKISQAFKPIRKTISQMDADFINYMNKHRADMVKALGINLLVEVFDKPMRPGGFVTLRGTATR